MKTPSLLNWSNWLVILYFENAEQKFPHVERPLVFLKIITSVSKQKVNL